MTQEHPERPRETDCFEAFRAGFMASAEGFNGEYRPSGADLESWLRDRYAEWRVNSD